MTLSLRTNKNTGAFLITTLTSLLKRASAHIGALAIMSLLLAWWVVTWSFLGFWHLASGWSIVIKPILWLKAPFPTVGAWRHPTDIWQNRCTLSYKCPCVTEVVVEEVFSTAVYYPIMFLDFSSFLSYNFFNNRQKKRKKVMQKNCKFQNIKLIFSTCMSISCLNDLGVQCWLWSK